MIICSGDQISYLTSPHILIATGSKPNYLGIEGEEHVLTSDSFFFLSSLPKKLLILGGGYIACELAHISSLLGSEVSIKVRSGILSSFDHDISTWAKQNLELDKIKVLDHTAHISKFIKVNNQI